MSTRVPSALAEALRERSEKTGRPVASLMREGLAREALAPLEEAARSQCATFMEAAEQTEEHAS